ncbi:DapH/DapD/GlmU-related protein [Vibrio sp. HN007]|uniref:DapH/DapD/GlmU-related protein n=1 Tax=Vibrio iocasae TaxID=3098914 RepID=UPI0035D47986
MYKIKSFEFLASEIASIVEAELVGKDVSVTEIKNISEPSSGALMMCYPKNKDLLKDIDKPCLVFCTSETVIENEFVSYIVTNTPKFDFFDFINNYLITETTNWIAQTISNHSEFYPGVEFGYNVKVGKNTIIAPGTKIGSNTVIGCNVVIRDSVSVGNGCIIKDNTVIGSEGFGYTKKENKVIHVPQLGCINISNNVVIGSCCTVERPALGATTISDNVKIDDLVQIGHNQFIGENTMIATGFKAVGGCTIGANCFIGIGAVITSKNVTIGDNCLIGAGAIITKPLNDHSVAYNKVELVVEQDKTKLDNLLGTPKVNNA